MVFNGEMTYENNICYSMCYIHRVKILEKEAAISLGKHLSLGYSLLFAFYDKGKKHL